MAKVPQFQQNRYEKVIHLRGWSGTWEDIKKDETVTAVYDINIYKVDFVDYDGTIIDSQSIEHGKGATA